MRPRSRPSWTGRSAKEGLTKYRLSPRRTLLARQVKRVVLHEIAHHFGISDERLVELDRY